ncbi:MAG: hypothetical protein FWD18_07530 [Micrococcales bacterium]|nr:hypothetical protein [Micrococcales bacterium]
MVNLTPEQRAELEAWGAVQADRLEALDPARLELKPINELPPEEALRHAADKRAIALRQADRELQEAVDQARAQGWSWHKISVPLQMTPEGARKRFSHA